MKKRKIQSKGTYTLIISLTNRDINVELELTSDSMNPDSCTAIPPNLYISGSLLSSNLLLFFHPFSYRIQKGRKEEGQDAVKVFQSISPIQKHHQKYKRNINKMLKYVLCIENFVHYVCVLSGRVVRLSFSMVDLSVCNTCIQSHKPTWTSPTGVICMWSDLNHKI